MSDPSTERSDSGPTPVGAKTTAVSLWFSKPHSKHHRRYPVVAAWSYQAETKKLSFSLWHDQGPAPYLSTLSAWISALQPETVHVSASNTADIDKDDKNLALWMQDVEEDLRNQNPNRYETNETNDDNDDEPDPLSAAAPTLTRVVPSVVPVQVHKDGVELLRALVQDDAAALYQLQANPDLTTINQGPTPPLLCAAAVLLEALGIYQPNLGPQSIVAYCADLAQQEQQQQQQQQQQNQDESESYSTKPPTVTSFSIQAMPATHSLVLDRAASTSLNVWPVRHAGQAAVEGATAWHASLYGLLSHYARTTMGRGKLQQWLLHPLIDLAPLLERQEAVAYLVDEGIVRQGLVDQGLQPLAGTNLEKLALQLESYQGVDDQDDNNDNQKGFVGSTRKALQALYELYLLASQKAPALSHQLMPILENAQDNDNNGGCSVASKSSLLQQHAESVLTSAQELERAIGLCEAVLDLDQAPREYVVKPEHSPRLAELSQELAQWQAELEKCHEDMNELWIDCAGLPPSNNNSRYVRLHIPDAKANGDASYEYQFRLPNSNDSKKLQEHKTLKQHKVTVHRILKNGVYFSTPTLKQLACQRQELDREYDCHQRHVVAQAVAVASSYAPILQRVRHSVAFLDAVAAMAQLAVFSPAAYCRPTLTDSNEDGHGIRLMQARHPCVERQETVDFIPNDIQLTLGKDSCWLVTGPNMGGKSTFIRSVGAIVTLAQMGSYVPCDSAEINLVHSIAARVGAGDSQERGISTFMSEMLEASAILQTATRRSLIIVDELGRGTSTFDGYGLARAICEHVVEKIQCLTVFATHFHELTVSLPKQFPQGQVHNCHVSAVTEDNEVVFLYKVDDGPCLDSFGIPVAEMAQVPPQAILDAKAKLRALEATSSSFDSSNNDKSDDSVDQARNGKRPRSEDSNGTDQDWLSKFQKINVPELLASQQGGKAMDGKAIQQVLLQALQS